MTPKELDTKIIIYSVLSFIGAFLTAGGMVMSIVLATTKPGYVLETSLFSFLITGIITIGIVTTVFCLPKLIALEVKKLAD